MKSVVNGIVIGMIIIGVIWLILYLRDSAENNNSNQAAIKNFAECELAGFEIKNSDPRICTTPDGRSFEEPEVGSPGVGI